MFVPMGVFAPRVEKVARKRVFRTRREGKGARHRLETHPLVFFTLLSSPDMAQTTATAGPIGLDNSLQVGSAKGNTSFVLEAIDKTSFQERPVVPPGPGMVQINVRQTGICGSDVHYWKHGRIGDFVLTKPMVSLSLSLSISRMRRDQCVE